MTIKYLTLTVADLKQLENITTINCNKFKNHFSPKNNPRLNVQKKP